MVPPRKEADGKLELPGSVLDFRQILPAAVHVHVKGRLPLVPGALVPFQQIQKLRVPLRCTTKTEPRSLVAYGGPKGLPKRFFN